VEAEVDEPGVVVVGEAVAGDEFNGELADLDDVDEVPSLAVVNASNNVSARDTSSGR